MSEDTNEALREINTDNADNQVWLIKVPKFLSEHWNGIGKGEIGKIHIKGGDNVNFYFYIIKITLSISGLSENNEFQLMTSANNLETQPLKIFSEDSDGSLALEGNIGLRCDIKIDVQSSSYRELMKTRHTKYNTKTRMTKVIDDKELFTPAIFNPNRVQVSTTGLGKRKTTDKKEKLPEDEVIDLIFDAFRNKSYWDLKGLEAETGQPKGYLKQVLEKVCILNKRGAHNHLYELKSEFKDKENPPQDGTTTTTNTK
ncbi:hypothetical protein DICPUDRAFT_38380 [Dictyostelium purpureum]|uniref:Uncharacterized protein n=1 Tax=Dictyostelium purpureum TaxID=5786 RepID=F0ZUC0_DICPU|nr:uncharacterized protein DICPUDRAFT_38380 [Dictyostelium purpureum]EGC32441.1 hypothetical protein DICPUDRAFT_38380 [Dictyostelium purpureum]|eukprot:XP_003291013.1 hypothetical protein DICPUDRAFT_38380 [Dictyostelium purpureum]